MNLQVKKRIKAQKPVKAYKVLCILPDDLVYTGPFRLEEVQPDQWVTARLHDYLGHTLGGGVGYHAFKSSSMADRGLWYMARHGVLSPFGYYHLAVPVYLRGEVAFGVYYGRYKGVMGEEMLVKSKHLPVKLAATEENK